MTEDTRRSAFIAYPDRNRQFGPPTCRWEDLHWNAYGWSTEQCDKSSHSANLLLCRKHMQEVAFSIGHVKPEHAEDRVRFRRKNELIRLRNENRRLALLVEQLRKPAPNKPTATDGFIYFLRVGGYIKIGWTSNLQKRMRQYQPDSQLLAVKPGTRKDENALHRKFAHLKTHGREWFPLAPQITEEADRIVADHGDPPIVDFSARRTQRQVGPRLNARSGPKPRGYVG